MTAPTPPPATCPIGWQPNALTPVFYGARTYGTAHGAPVSMRVYFPSLDGAVETAPILSGCGRYPVVLFVHGDCDQDPNHFRTWVQLPAQLARSGYVVVVPQLPAIGTHPSAENHPALAAIANSLTWLRQQWEHRTVLMPAAATGITGHSYGALLAARYARANTVAGFAGLSGVWQDWPVGSPPIIGLARPKLLLWGGPEDLFTSLTETQWNSLSTPKHRAVFATGVHWDYLPTGQTPCDATRGPCRLIASAAADLVTMFFAKYLAPELSPHLPGRVPDNLMPPALVLTPEQEFYAGGHLIGMRNMAGNPDCAVALTAVTGTERTVPLVLESSQSSADQEVRNAGLLPRFTGAGGANAWVSSQSPRADTRVPAGSTVTMALRTGPIP
ncbi:MAG: alpha/beta fold hydrolase [Pseudonocardiaceae bacterium]